MVGTVQSIAQILTWVINILFCGALIPQILLDKRMRSTRGISDAMLFFLYVGYAWNTIYVFCAGMPLAYKIFVPLTFMLSLVLVYQRFYYNCPKSTPKLKYAYVTHGVGWCAALPMAALFPAKAGLFVGWSIFVIWILFQLPQIIRLYRTRDTSGFSPLFPGMLLLGMGLELTSGVMLGFPLSSIFNSLRAVIGYSIMLYLYYKFNRVKS